MSPEDRANKRCFDNSWIIGARKQNPGVLTSTFPLYHAASVIVTADEKRALHLRFGAGGVDMETVAVARVATEHNMPWVAVRVVFDAADQDLPAANLAATDDDGRLSAASVVGLISSPRLWRHLVALGRARAAAGRSMRQLWDVTQPDLALS